MALFNQKDIRQIEERGSSVKAVQKQIDYFKKGFPWMTIVSPATPQRGIRVLSEEQVRDDVAYFEAAKVDGLCKFVPASGAASRMFKDTFAGLDVLEKGNALPESSPAARLVSEIRRFAFYDPALFGTDPFDGQGPSRDDTAWQKSVLEKVLREPGLGYGSKPKGVIRFHRYADGEVRTAIAEHLVEAQEYMRNPDGTCRLVITISPEHRTLFEEALAEVRPVYEARYGVRYDVRFTYQDKATDTIAVDAKNRPFRTAEGDLLFRPAGHGALIYNLDSVDAELVSIKNIDNVAHEKWLPETALYKKVLFGEALRLRDRIFGFLERLDRIPAEDGPECRQLCNEVEHFFDKHLCIQFPLPHNHAERVAMLRAKLNRPVRVCGMVRNEGEPGGGPFVIAGRDGCSSLQILESVQINQEDRGAVEALSRATHFNPVDLVCCLKDYKGGRFNLLDHVDTSAGFISSKSFQGRELKALELPGLWNGAMSDWNTLFVEVPLATFNPVKVVLDLLRPAHQG